MGQKLSKTSAFLGREIQIHVASPLFQLPQQLRWRCAHHVVNLLYLVRLVSAGKKGEKAQNFKEDAANTPHVHLVIIIAIC